MMKRFVFFTVALLLSFQLVFTASAASKNRKKAAVPSDESTATPETSPDVPEAFSADPMVTGVPNTTAGSVIVVDAESGQVLHEVNSDRQRPVASTQKLLTALIVAESGNLDREVRVQASDTWAEPSKLYLKPGDVYSRFDLLSILLVHSMNDVARALARDNAGSLEAFAAKMNARAAQLGMRNSHFVNPNGLPVPDQYSTARDMARVALMAYRNPTIREIVRMKKLVWRYNDGRTREFSTTNHVLKGFPLCNGMKTGYTEAAGHCLISSGTTNGRHIIVVVLGDNKNIWNDSYRLLAWGLSRS